MDSPVTLRPPAPPRVLHFGAPDPDTIRWALRAAEDAPLSYPFVGATAGELPAGWDHDAASRVVGRGPAAWSAAKTAIREWVPFSMPWVHLHDRSVPLQLGQHVSFSSRQLGVWTLNVCRVVAVYDEETPDFARFGFAYGTLDGHVVAGEERFLASWDRTSGDVAFEIRKFSRPNHPLVRLVSPVARVIQRRFTTEAIDAVARFVGSAR